MKYDEKYRIAVCDNDSFDRETVLRHVRAYFGQPGNGEADIRGFGSAAELLEEPSGFEYNIYFLDILMPGMNGTELGKEIRRVNGKAVIIYVTTSREFAFEAYGVRAMRYLEKPAEKADVWEILEQVSGYLDTHRETIVGIHTKQGLTRICMEDVMYIENVARSAIYVTRQGNKIQGICNRGSFEQSVEPFGCREEFVQPHKSYFVNLNYIHTLSANGVALDNGTEIPVSRKRYGDIKTAYLRYLANEGDE